MNYIYELLADLSSSGNQRWLFVFLVFTAVFILFLSGEFIFEAFKSPFRRRLAKLEDAVKWENKETHTSEFDKENRVANESSLLGLSSIVIGLDKKNHTNTQAQLIRAGIRTETALNTYYAIRAISLVLVSCIVLIVIQWLPHLTTNQIILYVVGGAYIGFTVPGIILDKIEAKRVTAIRKAFPDALDLLVVCVESGLGLTAAIPRTAKEIGISHPELSSELDIVSSEIRLGVDRVDSLRGLAIRTGLDEIRGLVALIDQSVRFGTGIAETLRVYSEEFRDKRTQKAEEEAAKIGTKMIFPLTFCIWPGFFLVAIGPAILGVLEAFK